MKTTHKRILVIVLLLLAICAGLHFNNFHLSPTHALRSTLRSISESKLLQYEALELEDFRLYLCSTTAGLAHVEMTRHFPFWEAGLSAIGSVGDNAFLTYHIAILEDDQYVLYGLPTVPNIQTVELTLTDGQVLRWEKGESEFFAFRYQGKTFDWTKMVAYDEEGKVFTEERP